MAETLFIDINNTSWTDVSTTAGNEGFLANPTDNIIYLLQAESVPSTTINNGYELRPGDDISYSITSPEVIYARSISPVAQLTNTPGLLGG